MDHRILISAIIAFSAIPVTAALAQSEESAVIDMIQQVDVDGDGALSLSEFSDFRTASFARLDRNDDDFIDQEDAGRGPVGRRISSRLPELLERFDENSDERLSRTEFIDIPIENFAAADTDGDEILDQDELAAFQENLVAE